VKKEKKMSFKVQELIITFKKYLFNTIHGQSVLEYSLLLAVVALIVLALFTDGFKPIIDLFNGTTEALINRSLE